jgi:hypothetical protein
MLGRWAKRRDAATGLEARGPGTAGYRRRMWRRVVWEGLASGLVGVAVMTAGEKLEQRLTGRPDSHVPARTLERLLGSKDHQGGGLRATNLAMHYGQAVALGPLRSLMAHVGLRGAVASSKFTVVRLTTDQILENGTGVGAPPQTWPRPELVVDLVHKAVYGFTTGLVADLLAARSGPGAGQQHAAMPGRRSGAPPLPRAAAPLARAPRSRATTGHGVR